MIVTDMRDTLQQIGAKHSTDKASHEFHNISYLKIYDFYFRYYQDRPMSILEIGVKRGASLYTWKDYFKQGKIYGIDNNNNCLKDYGDRIRVEIGQQQDEVFLEALCRECGPFDIVIDDGSHINELTIKSFKYLWPHIQPGGYYVIEDLRNSYTKELSKDMKRGGWLSPNQKPEIDLVNNRKDMDHLFNSIIQKMDYKIQNYRFIHFWSNNVIVGKV